MVKTAGHWAWWGGHEPNDEAGSLEMWKQYLTELRKVGEFPKGISPTRAEMEKSALGAIAALKRAKTGPAPNPKEMAASLSRRLRS
jgi:hypothetical protein